MHTARAVRFPLLRSRWISRLSLVLPFLVVLSCSSSIDPEDFDIIDTWVLTDLEGSSGTFNSDWTFAQDGTYQWDFFSDVLSLDLDGVGTYTLTGDVLTVTGIVSTTVISTFTVKELELSLQEDSFSFEDEEGSRWTYERQ